MTEILSIIGLLAIIYFLFNLYQTESIKKDFKNVKDEYANEILRRRTRHNWNFRAINKSYVPIQEQIRDGVKPEDFKYSLDFPDGKGFLSIDYHKDKGWSALYYPKDPAFNTDYLIISRKGFQLQECFSVAEQLFDKRVRNKNISLRELLSNLDP